ncbi:MAG: peptidoglycan-binding protein [Pseudomonadota bacterium]
MTDRDLQLALKSHGFDPGPVDGIRGPQTDSAVVAFKRAHGLRARPYVGPITLKLLGLATQAHFDVPWINELAKHIGLHERRDNAVLRRWLGSDGKTLGDPARFPWCGDAIDTAFRLTLPDEPRPGPLGQNLYLARNWQHFGRQCGPAFGAVVVFWRGKRNGIYGHVANAVAWDSKRRRVKVRGGNQSNTISDAWLRTDRILAWRAPITWPHALPALPGLSSAGARVSENEA